MTRGGNEAESKISAQPILWLMYFLNFLDRNAIVNGKLNNLDNDLNMKGSEYNTCVSVFFVGSVSKSQVI